MAQLFRNNAFSALGASLSIGATTLTVAASQGDRFPIVASPDFFMLTLQDSSNNIEIVRVTARAAGADSMTVTRAQEGTAARAWNIGGIVELRLTAFALNPLALLAGASTAAAIRAALDVPSRAGGDASGNWAISISGNAATATTAGACTGNAATVTNGVYTVGNQTIGGNKNFTGNTAFGGTAAAAAAIDAQTTGANVLTSLLTTGIADLNFRLGAMNGVAGASGASQGKFGLFYLGSGEVATIDFIRGGGATDGSMAFRTSGNVRATLSNTGDFTATGNITAYSDERLKKDWAPVRPDFLERLAFVKHGTYTRIDTGERQAGVSAQNFKDLLPEVVQEGKEGFMSVAYGNAALVAAVKLAERVIELEARLAKLEG